MRRVDKGAIRKLAIIPRMIYIIQAIAREVPPRLKSVKGALRYFKQCFR